MLDDGGDDGKGQQLEMVNEVFSFLRDTRTAAMAIEYISGLLDDPILMKVLLKQETEAESTTFPSVRLLLRAVVSNDVNVCLPAIQIITNLAENLEAARALIASSTIPLVADVINRASKNKADPNSSAIVSESLKAISNLTRLEEGQNSFLMLPSNFPTTPPSESESKQPLLPCHENPGNVEPGILKSDALMMQLVSLFFSTPAAPVPKGVSEEDFCSGPESVDLVGPDTTDDDEFLRAYRQKRLHALRHGTRTNVDEDGDRNKKEPSVHTAGGLDAGFWCGRVLVNMTSHWVGRAFFIRAGPVVLNNLSHQLSQTTRRPAALKCIHHLCMDERLHVHLSNDKTMFLQALCMSIYPKPGDPRRELKSNTHAAFGSEGWVSFDNSGAAKRMGVDASVSQKRQAAAAASVQASLKSNKSETSSSPRGEVTNQTTESQPADPNSSAEHRWKVDKMVEAHSYGPVPIEAQRRLIFVCFNKLLLNAALRDRLRKLGAYEIFRVWHLIEEVEQIRTGIENVIHLLVYSEEELEEQDGQLGASVSQRNETSLTLTTTNERESKIDDTISDMD